MSANARKVLATPLAAAFARADASEELELTDDHLRALEEATRDPQWQARTYEEALVELGTNDDE